MIVDDSFPGVNCVVEALLEYLFFRFSLLTASSFLLCLDVKMVKSSLTIFSGLLSQTLIGLRMYVKENRAKKNF